MANSSISLARYLPESMVVLYDSTLTADAASFDVQNIPQGYKHLRVVLKGRASTAGSGIGYDSSGGAVYRAYWRGQAVETGASPVGWYSSSVPFTWETSDQVQISIEYQF